MKIKSYTHHVNLTVENEEDLMALRGIITDVLKRGCFKIKGIPFKIDSFTISPTDKKLGSIPAMLAVKRDGQ